jgi:hypothetical protein
MFHSLVRGYSAKLHRLDVEKCSKKEGGTFPPSVVVVGNYSVNVVIWSEVSRFGYKTLLM